MVRDGTDTQLRFYGILGWSTDGIVVKEHFVRTTGFTEYSCSTVIGSGALSGVASYPCRLVRGYVWWSMVKSGGGKGGSAV